MNINRLISIDLWSVNFLQNDNNVWDIYKAQYGIIIITWSWYIPVDKFTSLMLVIKVYVLLEE